MNTPTIHKVVIHVPRRNAYDLSLGINPNDLPELRKQVHLSFDYTEQLGEVTFDHYTAHAVLARLLVNTWQSARAFEQAVRRG